MSVSLSDIERRELQSDCKKKKKKQRGKKSSRQKLLRTAG